MVGLRDDAEVTNWIDSKAYPFAVHSFKTRSISSSVTVLISTTLYAMAVIIDEDPAYSNGESSWRDALLAQVVLH
jgi:hypothetical protein